MQNVLISLLSWKILCTLSCYVILLLGNIYINTAAWPLRHVCAAQCGL